MSATDKFWLAAMDKQKLRYELTRAMLMENTNFNVTKDEQRVAVIEEINTYSHDLLRRITDFIAGGTTEDESLFRTNSIRLLVLRKAAPEQINEGICFLPFLGHLTAHAAKWMVESLHFYEEFPESKDYSAESPAVVSQCAALLLVISAVIELIGLEDSDTDTSHLLDTSTMTIANKALVGLTLAYPERAEDIARVIVERKITSDTSLIRDIVTSETKSLSNGII